MTRNLRHALIGIALAALTTTGWSEQSASFGEYTVHYSAFTTDHLDSTVARTYNIVRSKNRALINIAVLRKVMGTTGQPVKAAVAVTATNLNLQLRKVDMREINDAGGIYYIAELAVNDQETLNFTLSVTPEGMKEPYAMTFQQQFFTK
jgi:hypothetical protein